jgi:U3 small nucleolar RNA-associated protein 20
MCIESENVKSKLVEPMVGALYRVVNDETLKGQGMDDLKTFATQVLSHLQKSAGPTLYLETYNRVHQHVLKKRQERKNLQVRQAILDPEARAKRKLQKSEMKKQSRKRKSSEFSQRRVKERVAKKRRAA